MEENQSWEWQKGETSKAFGAFCTYRDYGSAGNIKMALKIIAKDEAEVERKYRTWRNWAGMYNWTRRAADYDDYLDKKKLAGQCEVFEKLQD